MAIYKRKATWWADYADADGRRVQCSLKTKSKEAAQELHDKLLADRWKVKELGCKQRRSWLEAVVRWGNEKTHKKSFKTDIEHFRLLDDYLGKLSLDEISLSHIDNFKTKRHQQGVTNSTINRSLALVRAVLRAAQKDWEWLDRIPPIKLLQEPKKRIRWLTSDEIARLLKELPPHLYAMAVFSLSTGLRASNVTYLRWDQIDLSRACAWIHEDESKSGHAIAVPLSQAAITIIREQMGKHLEYVFTYKGKPVTRPNNRAWRKAVKRSGLENFRWHDLRHCWATAHIQNGTPIHILKALGGWETQSMVERYAHLSSEHLHEFADNAPKKLRLVK